eukprot:5968148-Ditylum_brightwellii.AAC.1
MRIAKDFSREAIQLVATKESRTYKFCTQNEEDILPMYSLIIEVFELGSPKEWLIFKHQVKQVLEGQNIGDMDATYTLV